MVAVEWPELRLEAVRDQQAGDIPLGDLERQYLVVAPVGDEDALRRWSVQHA